MVILVVIVVGVVILVVLFRAKKKKQNLVINKIQKTTIDKEHVEMELKHKKTTEMQTEAPPNVPSKSEDLVNLNSPLTVGYSEIELQPDDSKQALQAKPPKNKLDINKKHSAFGPSKVQ